MLWRLLTLNKRAENPFDHGDLVGAARSESDPLILDALALAAFQNLHGVALFVQQQAMKTIGRHAAGTETLTGNLCAPLEDLRAELATVTGRTVSLDAEMKTVKKIVLLAKPDGCKDHFLAMFCA